MFYIIPSFSFLFVGCHYLRRKGPRSLHQHEHWIIIIIIARTILVLLPLQAISSSTSLEPLDVWLLWLLFCLDDGVWLKQHHGPPQYHLPPKCPETIDVRYYYLRPYDATRADETTTTMEVLRDCGRRNLRTFVDNNQAGEEREQERGDKKATQERDRIQLGLKYEMWK